MFCQCTNYLVVLVQKLGIFVSHKHSFSLCFRNLDNVLKNAPSGLRRFLATEIPLKMMKNAFISPYKLFSFSKYLNVCLDSFVMLKNGLIRKIRLILKFMTSQPGKQTISMHILPNISRNKGN